MAEKDFLSQFSSENKKPDSFKEEKRIPVEKKQKPWFKIIAIVLGSLLACFAIVYLLFLRPKIEVPDFVGENRSDVISWVKQQGIATSGIVFKDEYSFDKAENVVLEQSLTAGTKVKKNAKITFVISLGADPDEKINVPDLKQMTKAEIESWISNNKLQKTKISTSYSDEIAEGEVIGYEFVGCDEDSFTRGSTLKINISKGVKPEGEVLVEDFKNKSFSEVETWAKAKKIELKKSEAYHNDILIGNVISQSIEANKKIKEGDTLTVVVSKGKAVYAPDFSTYSLKQALSWANKNGIILDSEETRYSNDVGKDMIISQSVKKGYVVDEMISVVVSLGRPEIGKFNTIEELESWISQVNENGAKLKYQVEDYQLNDDVPVGDIISHSSSVKVGDTIKVIISKGHNIFLSEEFVNQINECTIEEEIRSLLESNSLIRFKITYQIDTEHDNSEILAIYRDDDMLLKENSYMPESTIINVVICDNSSIEN